MLDAHSTAMASNHPTLAMLLVRHAMPVRPLAGESSDIDRELSPEGMEQAKKLALTYADAGIAAIYSSPLRRAMQTAEPLANRLGIEIERVEDSGASAWCTDIEARLAAASSEIVAGF